MAITVSLPDGIDASALPEINEIDETYYFKPDAGRLLASPADETPCEPADVQPEELDIAYAAHYLQEATTLTIQTTTPEEFGALIKADIDRWGKLVETMDLDQQ